MGSREVVPFDAETTAACEEWAKKVGCTDMWDLFDQMRTRTSEFEKRLNAAGYEYRNGGVWICVEQSTSQTRSNTEQSQAE